MNVDCKRKRIMIIGQPGSGKSTLARRLGKILGLPVVHIDLIHWEPGWVERVGSEKDRLCSEVHSREEWIFEGGRSSTWPQRLERSDTLIYLDFPLFVRAWRILKRRIKYHGVSRPDLPDGCPEQLNWEFVRFVWRTRTIGRTRMLQFFESASAYKESHRLRNRSEVEAFVKTISSVQGKSIGW